MELKNILVEETAMIREAIEKLETFRCKIVYVVNKGKLCASISDGDARRFLLRNGNIDGNVKDIANFRPRYFYENKMDGIRECFRKSGLQSVPIVNYNNEVVSVVFRNDVIVEKREHMEVPLVIMAGGKGTRLHPYTNILPKALIPIGEIPITERIIQRFYDVGCRDFHMIVNNKKSMIKSYFSSIDKDYGIHYVDEEVPLGTGGGLSLLKGCIREDFFLSNCDILIDSSYVKMFEFHKEQKNFITIVAAKRRSVVPYGVLKISENGIYEGVDEKPERSFDVITGLYIVNATVIEELLVEPIGFPDIIESYRQKGEKIGVYQIEEDAFMDMGQIEELEEMRKKLNIQ